MAISVERTTISLDDIGLDDIPLVAWRFLTAGVNSATDPFHTPCIATMSIDGPTQRTVVLRHVDTEQRIIACHTDRRSMKIRDVLDEPRASWLFYDRKRKLQLRISGIMTLHTDDEFAETCWSHIPAQARACYNATLKPGQQVSAPPRAPNVADKELELLNARSHFAVLACQITFLDWLFLSAKGHRRAQFRWHGDQCIASWIAP